MIFVIFPPVLAKLESTSCDNISCFFNLYDLADCLPGEVDVSSIMTLCDYKSYLFGGILADL